MSNDDKNEPVPEPHKEFYQDKNPVDRKQSILNDTGTEHGNIDKEQPILDDTGTDHDAKMRGHQAREYEQKNDHRERQQTNEDKFAVERLKHSNLNRCLKGWAAGISIIVVAGMGFLLFNIFLLFKTYTESVISKSTAFWGLIHTQPPQLPSAWIVGIFVAPIASITIITIMFVLGATRKITDDDLNNAATLAAKTVEEGAKNQAGN